jgi:leucyl-tRNA synthetase
MSKYEKEKIESKWQNYWVKEKLNALDLDKAKKPFYNLMMFPYPSAEGLHIGSMFTFSGVDTFGRYKKMQGYDVFEPIGLDAFGIHSENYALKIGEHIHSVSERTSKHFYEQLHKMGNMYDWDKTLETNKPEYYKWTQWLFVQMFKAGLAYRKKAYVKYCPGCKTVLSDEQVINDKCERCSTLVENKDLEQWFFKITKYADRLYENLKKIDWDDDVKLGQKNWIGKKTGINISYKVEGLSEEIVCFTTRPDTNFGATFLVLAPEHDFVTKITDGVVKADKKIKKEIINYVKTATSKSDIDRISEGRKKTGVFTGFYVINSLNGAKLPVYVSDFVLGNFGTGAVVGVPAHDVRDFEFATQFGLEIIRVVVGKDGDDSKVDDIKKVQEKEGTMINSQFLDGMDIHTATVKIMDHLEKKGWGKRISSFNLRDWCVSRQRYWGPPIPMIYCKSCNEKGLSWFNTAEDAGKNLSKEELAEVVDEMKGWYPEENLPVVLPDIKEFDAIKPDGSGRGPLALQKDFVATVCPHCKEKAERETDVSDPFVDSCWYFLRYPFTEFDNIPFGGNFSNPKSFFTPEIDKKNITLAQQRMKRWGPVTSYIGGKEHTVLHLLYARFITMVFHDVGYLDFEEPFTKFIGHGLITKDGAKMSKSKGNVVNPDEYINKYGADAIRLYLRFLGPFTQGGDWKDDSMQGMYKFVNKVWNLYQEIGETGKAGETVEAGKTGKTGIPKNDEKALLEKADHILHKTIKTVGDDLDSLKFNTAVAKIMQFFNWYVEQKDSMTAEMRWFYLKNMALVLAPLTPFIAEEFWKITGGKGSVHSQKWPEYESGKVQAEMIKLPVQVNGKVRALVEIPFGSSQETVEKTALSHPNVAKHLEGKKVVKIISVPNKIINFLVK